MQQPGVVMAAENFENGLMVVDAKKTVNLRDLLLQRLPVTL